MFRLRKLKKPAIKNNLSYKNAEMRNTKNITAINMGGRIYTSQFYGKNFKLKKNRSYNGI